MAVTQTIRQARRGTTAVCAKRRRQAAVAPAEGRPPPGVTLALRQMRDTGPISKTGCAVGLGYPTVSMIRLRSTSR